MSNNQLPAETIERIKADAIRAVKVKDWGESLQIEMYIDGATAEVTRVQPLVHLLELIKTLGPVDSLTQKLIDKKLKEWHGKETNNGNI